MTNSNSVLLSVHWRNNGKDEPWGAYSKDLHKEWKEFVAALPDRPTWMSKEDPKGFFLLTGEEYAILVMKIGNEHLKLFSEVMETIAI